MPNPLFSTYRRGENRITAAILYVFERLSFGLMTQILQALVQEPEKQLLTFRRQPAGPDSVPDARIRSSFSYWIETKRAPRDVKVEQIRAFLNALDLELSVETQRLLILTPDVMKPNVITYMQDERVVWANYEDLVATIEESLDLDENWLTSESYIPNELERELLRELVRFLTYEGLVGRAKRQVLVVAARMALPEYLEFSAYICQPNRTFQESSHMAFYANSRIDHHIPVIMGNIESIVFLEEDVKQRSSIDEETQERLLFLVKQLRESGSSHLGQEHKVIFLSSPDAPETIKLANDIQNDLYSESGRMVAFTQGQRYIPLGSINASPKTTSVLLGFES